MESIELAGDLTRPLHFSMVGYGTNKGIVPIACDEIFKKIEEVRGGPDAEKYQFQVTIQMLEIYNEQVRADCAVRHVLLRTPRDAVQLELMNFIPIAIAAAARSGTSSPRPTPRAASRCHPPCPPAAATTTTTVAAPPPPTLPPHGVSSRRPKGSSHRHCRRRLRHRRRRRGCHRRALPRTAAALAAACRIDPGPSGSCVGVTVFVVVVVVVVVLVAVVVWLPLAGAAAAVVAFLIFHS